MTEIVNGLTYSNIELIKQKEGDTFDLRHKLSYQGENISYDVTIYQSYFDLEGMSSDNEGLPIEDEEE